MYFTMVLTIWLLVDGNILIIISFMARLDLEDMSKKFECFESLFIW